MDLPITVEIPEAYKPVMGTDSSAAQFRVKYTLTTLDAGGNPIGMYSQKWVNDQYDGPESGTTAP